MKDNFKFKIEINPKITIGDINGNIGLTSLLFILLFFLIIVKLILI